MSDYTATFHEAITLLGFKKALAQFLLAGKAIERNSVGQIVVHINNGGVTRVVKTADI